MKRLLASLLAALSLTLSVPLPALAQSGPHFHSATIDTLTTTGAMTPPVTLPTNAALRPPAATDDGPTGHYLPAGAISSLVPTSNGSGITSGTCAIAAPPVGLLARQATCHLLIMGGQALPIVDDPGAGYAINTYPAVTITDNGGTHATATASVSIMPAMWNTPNGLYQTVSSIGGQGTWLPVPAPALGLVDAAGVQPHFVTGTVLQNKLYTGPAINVQAGAASADIPFLPNGHLDTNALDQFDQANLYTAGNLFLPSLGVTVFNGGSGCTTGVTTIVGGTAVTPLYVSLVASGGVVTSATVLSGASPAAYSVEPANPVSVAQTGCTATLALTMDNNGNSTYPTVNVAYDQSTTYVAQSVSIAYAGNGSCVTYGTAGVVGPTGAIDSLQLSVTASGGVVTGVAIHSGTPGHYAVQPPSVVSLNQTTEPGCTALISVTWAVVASHNDAVQGWQMTNQPMTVLSGGSGCTAGTYPLVGGTTGVGGTAATVTLTVSGGAVTAVSYASTGMYQTPPPNPVAVSGCTAQLSVSGWQTTGPSVSPLNTINGDRTLVFDSNDGVFSGSQTLSVEMMFIPGLSLSSQNHMMAMIGRVEDASRSQTFLQVGPTANQVVFSETTTPQLVMQNGSTKVYANALPSQSPQFLAYVSGNNTSISVNDLYAQAAGASSGSTVTGGTIGYSDYLSGTGGPTGSQFEFTALALFNGIPAISEETNVKAAAYAQANINPQLPDLMIWDGASNVSGHESLYNLATPRMAEALIPRPMRHYNTAYSGSTIVQMNSWFLQHVAPILQYAGGARVVCYLSAGANDIDTGSTAATVEGYVASYVFQAKLAGCTKVILATTFPNSVHILGNSPTGATAQYNAFDAWIDANSLGADAVADEGGDAIMGNPANTTNTAYYFPDGAHGQFLGRAYFARIDAAAVNSIR